MAADDVEQKFLAAIAANPSDRDARSVYADWLDERGDPRGEYLRLELQLHDIPARLAALAAHIEEPWIVAIARECDVLLFDGGANKIGTIKVIREITGLGLRDSKDLVERATRATPQRIRERIAVDEARDLAKKFADTGALVRILAHDGIDATPMPVRPGYGVASNPPYPLLESFAVVITAVPHHAKILAIKAVRELTGLGLKDAKDLVERVATAGPQTVIDGVGRDRANAAANLLGTACTAEVRSAPAPT